MTSLSELTIPSLTPIPAPLWNEVRPGGLSLPSWVPSRGSLSEPLSPCRYFVSHKPNKTWQQVFWLAVSIAVNNAYILYKMSDAYHVKRYSRAQFGERLVRELLGLEDTPPTH